MIEGAKSLLSPTTSAAVAYIGTGLLQPLLMTACKSAGLADPRAQFCMFFYYAGPALLAGGLANSSPLLALKACGVAAVDVVAQLCNYTGASLAGPTIYAVVYSSLTVWTALWSRLLLGRRMPVHQWLAVAVVFGGLALTARESSQLGDSVIQGTLLVFVGSILSSLSYIASEAVMTRGKERLSVDQNAAIQSLFSATILGLWQLLYTRPRWHELIVAPAAEAATSLTKATGLLIVFAGASLVHAYAFYYTLRHATGGATSAGVMKGLQAVLVFVATHVAYCGRVGGAEMCLTTTKATSIVVVAGGVALFTTVPTKTKRWSRILRVYKDHEAVE